MNEKPQYWLVGANWSNTDMTDLFVRRGYWEIGYNDKQKPEYAELRSQMKVKDRIAIKARGGKGASFINIKAVGIIREIDPDDGRVYVEWVLKNLNRKVPSKGKFSTIHPPLSDGDVAWIHSIFTV